MTVTLIVLLFIAVASLFAVYFGNNKLCPDISRLLRVDSNVANELTA